MERAQNASEKFWSSQRRMTLEFAESMNIQRAIVYEERDRLIKQEGRLDDIVEKVLRSVFSSVVHKKEYKEPVAFYRYMLDNVSYQVDPEKAHQTFRSKKTKETISYGRLLKASWKLSMRS